MAENAFQSQNQSNGLARLADKVLQPPYLRLVIFGTVLLWKPLAHSVLVLMYTAFPDPEKYLAGFLVGLLGFILIWKGAKKTSCQPVPWDGWAEHSFGSDGLNNRSTSSANHFTYKT